MDTDVTPPTKKPIALNINLDSLRECLKLAGVNASALDIHDPAFFEAADRFFEYGAKYNAKFTIFVIGSDLKNKANYKRVREWAGFGHEIGNHTFNHHQNYGALSPNSMRSEFSEAHKIISECIGKEPKGFISPSWSYSPLQLDLLHEYRYIYDTSLFPSFFMPLILAKLKLQSKVDNGLISPLRQDLWGSLFGSRQPFMASSQTPWYPKKSTANHKSVAMLPLPMTRFRFPIWHSISFMFSHQVYARMLEDAIRQTQGFYYLLHPSDLICPKTDLGNWGGKLGNIERMLTPLHVKKSHIQNAMTVLSRHAKFVTMSNLAHDYTAKKE